MLWPSISFIADCQLPILRLVHLQLIITSGNWRLAIGNVILFQCTCDSPVSSFRSSYYRFNHLVIQFGNITKLRKRTIAPAISLPLRLTT